MSTSVISQFLANQSATTLLSRRMNCILKSSNYRMVHVISLTMVFAWAPSKHAWIKSKAIKQSLSISIFKYPRSFAICNPWRIAHNSDDNVVPLPTCLWNPVIHRPFESRRTPTAAAQVVSLLVAPSAFILIHPRFDELHLPLVPVRTTELMLHKEANISTSRSNHGLSHSARFEDLLEK